MIRSVILFCILGQISCAKIPVDRQMEIRVLNWNSAVDIEECNVTKKQDCSRRTHFLKKGHMLGKRLEHRKEYRISIQKVYPEQGMSLPEENPEFLCEVKINSRVVYQKIEKIHHLKF